MFMQIALLVLFVWIVLSGGARSNGNGNGNGKGSIETFVILFLFVAWVAWKIFNYL